MVGASSGGRGQLSRRDHTLSVVFGIWMVIGLFLDGWAHDNNQPETFFTPWHGVLYSGFAGAAAVALWPVLRNRRAGTPLLESIPSGHVVTIAALAAFSLGAVGDLVWHETIGIEIGVEALLSPTHLLLLVSGIAALSAPFRSAWADDGAAASLRTFMPVIVSVALTTAVIGFFLVYLSPFVNDAAGSEFSRTTNALHEHPATDADELLQLLGVASILMVSVLIALAVQLVARRWAAPPGTYTVMLTIIVFLFVALDEFRQPALILAGPLAGAPGDSAARRLPSWAVPPIVVATLWTAYFAIYEVALGGVKWSAELWTGTVVLAALLAFAVGFVGRRRPDSSPASAPTLTEAPAVTPAS